jgi:hypothetical protein
MSQLLYVSRRMAASAAARWLLLIHSIPPKPAYFRAKVGRRLQRAGAVPIKNSVYALPLSEATQEDFQWIAREILQDGGEATLCRADFVDGMRDDQVEALFQVAREGDYAAVAEEARSISGDMPRTVGADDERQPGWDADVARLRKRMAEIALVDFFGAPGRLPAEAAIEATAERLRKPEKASDGPKPRQASFRGRTWVTRKNVHVDRIASAWLVRRFIDAKAKFKFVPGSNGYKSKSGEITFDMFEADFTHVGDRCTFEVLVERFELGEPGLRALGEIIHDIDVKDGKFSRSEAPGVSALVAGIALTHREDERRIEVGGVMLDALLELYQRRRRGALP